MRSINRILKTLKTLAKIAGVFFVAVIVVFFLFRNILLNKAIERISAKLESKYHTILHINQAGFKGITGVELLGITAVPVGGDTLLSIDTFETNIRFWSALLGKLRIKEIKVNHGFFQLTKRDGLKNFDVFLHKVGDSATIESANEPSKGTHIAKRVYQIIDALLDQIPNEMELSQLEFRIVDEQFFANIFIESMSQHGDAVNAILKVSDAINPQQHWRIAGYGDPGSKKADINFYNLDTGKVLIPYLNQKFHLLTGFDTIHIRLDQVEMKNDQLSIKGYSGITNFLVNHPKIAKNDVVVDNASVNYHFLLGEDFVSVDSTTQVEFSKIAFHPFVKLTTGIDTVFSLSVDIARTSAQDFITSLPEGLFKHFKGMEVKGDFGYRLDFVYNENKPQDLVFESKLKDFHDSFKAVLKNAEDLASIVKSNSLEAEKRLNRMTWKPRE